jgi:hypothetical protein
MGEGDTGVFQFNAGLGQVRRGDLDIRRRLLQGHLGIIELLQATRLVPQQIAITLRLLLGALPSGAGADQGRLGAIPDRLVASGIDEVEGLAGGDLATLRELAGLDDAAHLGPHLRDPEGRGAAHQFHGQIGGLRHDGEDAQLGWRHLTRRPTGSPGGGTLTTAGEQEGGDQTRPP